MDVVVAGAIAGIVSTLVCHPLDMVRTSLQLFPDKHRNSYSCFREIFRDTNGFYRLYSGILPPLLAQAAYKSCIFSTNVLFDQMRIRLEIDKSRTTIFCGGLTAGIVNSFLVTPVEFIRNSLIEYHTTASSSMSEHFKFKRIATILSGDGMNVFRGLPLTMIRDGFGLGVYFLVYSECMRIRSLYHPSIGSFDWLGVLSSGAMAGIGFWTVALPVDTAKTLVQSKSYIGGNSFMHAVKQAQFRIMVKCWPIAFLRGIIGASMTLGSYNLIMFHQNRA